MNARMRGISCVRPKLTELAMRNAPATSSRPLLKEVSAASTESTIARHWS
jgi:hypothetical protein